MLKSLSSAILVFSILTSVMADFSDSAAKVARKRKASKPILCGPKADKAAGVVALADAVKDLKTKSTIRLQPGDYGAAMIEIKAFDILIEGANPEECCNLNLVLLGKDCVVRNIYLQSLIATRDITIVDSRFHELVLRPDWKKADQVIYNCCMNRLFVNPALRRVFIKYVTIAHANEGIELGQMNDPKTGKKVEGELFIGNSVVCGDTGAFYIETASLGKLETIFSKSLFHGGKGLLLISALKTEKPKLATLKRYLGKYKQKGKVLVTDPEFEDPKGFALSKKSKAIKLKAGVKLNKKMVPVP